MFQNGSKYITINNVYTAIGLLAFTFSVPLWASRVLSNNRHKLEMMDTRRKYENLYPDIHLTRNSWTIYYWPIMM